MTTASAPAAWALTAFSAKVQVPRWISAIVPAGKPVKSVASHPLVWPFAVPGAGTTRSTAVTPAVTSPLPE